MIQHESKLVNARQIRAARSWLGWSQEDLATHSGVARVTIARIELADEIRKGRTIKDIQRAFEDAGIEFLFEDSDPVGFRVRRTATENKLGEDASSGHRRQPKH